MSMTSYPIRTQFNFFIFPHFFTLIIFCYIFLALGISLASAQTTNNKIKTKQKERFLLLGVVISCREVEN